jgi:hypothetical protein
LKRPTRARPGSNLQVTYTAFTLDSGFRRNDGKWESPAFIVTPDLIRGPVFMMLLEERTGKIQIRRAGNGSEAAESGTGGQCMGLIRAALEMALPVFREHPGYFVYVDDKARKEWQQGGCRFAPRNDSRAPADTRSSKSPHSPYAKN